MKPSVTILKAGASGLPAHNTGLFSLRSLPHDTTTCATTLPEPLTATEWFLVSLPWPSTAQLTDAGTVDPNCCGTITGDTGWNAMILQDICPTDDKF